MARSLYRYKYDLLIGWGYLPFEAREFARQYTTPQIRTLPYFRDMSQWRRLYVSNLRSRGYSNAGIRDRIYALYDTRNWLTDVGRPDPWQMLRRFRKQAIEDDEYIPPKRKGGHHPKGVSKGDIVAQKKRRKVKSALEKYAQGRGRE